MSASLTVLVFIIGAAFGAGLVLLVSALRRRDTAALAKELAGRAEEQRINDLQALFDRMKDTFGSLSLDALSRNSSEFLHLAQESLARQSMSGRQDLEGKKQLIDQSIGSVREDL